MNKATQILLGFVAGCLILIVGAGIIMAVKPDTEPEVRTYGNAYAFTRSTKTISVFFAGGAREENWLSVNRFNAKSYDAKGFDPCYTTLYSDFKPIITRIGDKWEIGFVSEIGKDLP